MNEWMNKKFQKVLDTYDNAFSSIYNTTEYSSSLLHSFALHKTTGADKSSCLTNLSDDEM